MVKGGTDKELFVWLPADIVSWPTGECQELDRLMKRVGWVSEMHIIRRKTQ